MAGCEVRVFFGGEHAVNVVVLVDGLAVVASFLLVPPVAIGVTELALQRGRVDVAAILRHASVMTV